MGPMEFLTFGLLVFAGVQVWLQWRQERARRSERQDERNEALDRAFHYAFAEHFRLESLADVLQRSDLVEMTILGILEPSDVLPVDSRELIRAFSASGSEGAVLGGAFLGACVDVERSLGILVGSVQAFSRQAPDGMTDGERVAWVRQEFGPDIEPWERSTCELVQELSWMAWDAAQHNPRAQVERTLDFSDDMKSRFSQAMVKAMVERSKPVPDKPWWAKGG